MKLNRMMKTIIRNEDTNYHAIRLGTEKEKQDKNSNILLHGKMDDKLVYLLKMYCSVVKNIDIHE